jgi:hypothetical protein
MLLSTLLVSPLLWTQQETSSALKRFDKLSQEEKVETFQILREKLKNSSNVILEKAGNLLQIELEQEGWMEPGATYAYSSKKYAPKLKLNDRVLKESHYKWKAISKTVFPEGIIEKKATYQFNYINNKLTVPPKIDYTQRLSHYLKGSWGEHDLLQAVCLSQIANKEKMRKCADYFAHTYRDRDGYIYPKITLFDIWGAQTEFGISDVEGIAFLQNVLDEHRIESPIDKRYHSKLYQRIKEYFEEYREYRDIRNSLAALHLDPNASIPRILEAQRENFALAWMILDYDPLRMANYLEAHPTRDAFLAAIYEDIKPILFPELGLPIPDSYIANLTAKNTWKEELIEITRETLKDCGLLGFRR